MKRSILNVLGCFFLFGLYLLTAWAMTGTTIYFDRALGLTILLVCAQNRWHQNDRKSLSEESAQ